MAFTYTRTKTKVLIIGEELAKHNENLARIAEKMREIGAKYKDELNARGTDLEPTNDPEQLSFIAFQWKEVMPMVVSREDLMEINEMLSREGSSEAGREIDRR